MQTLRQFINMVKEAVDIQAVAQDMEFLPTTKKDLTYRAVTEPITQDNIDQMPALSFGQSAADFELETVTEKGHETFNTVHQGDWIVSGPSKEKYNIGAESKLIKAYPIEVGPGRRKPDVNAVRYVARYMGKQSVDFIAPWGKPMTLEPGDYLVKEPDAHGKYYRIAQFEYEQTYNPPGR